MATFVLSAQPTTDRSGIHTETRLRVGLPIGRRSFVRGASPLGVTMFMIFLVAQHGVSHDATATDDDPLQGDTEALFESDGLPRRRIARACT
jgi:hypothetical protein